MKPDLCNEPDPRVGVRLNRNGRVVRGTPRCQMPVGHKGDQHEGEGWIWDEHKSQAQKPGLNLNLDK